MKTARIEPVADGVWASMAELDGAAVANAGFVDLGGTALVFDTHAPVPEHYRELGFPDVWVRNLAALHA